jgi:imidazolonepropionase-like amidohydrolase
VLPGLVDAHLHLRFDASGDPAGYLAGIGDDLLREQMAEAARRALRAGVTTVRDLGDRGYLALDLRDSGAAGGAGPPITTPGRHCHFLGGAAGGERGLRATEEVAQQLGHSRTPSLRPCVPARAEATAPRGPGRHGHDRRPALRLRSFVRQVVRPLVR